MYSSSFHMATQTKASIGNSTCGKITPAAIHNAMTSKDSSKELNDTVIGENDIRKEKTYQKSRNLSIISEKANFDNTKTQEAMLNLIQILFTENWNLKQEIYRMHNAFNTAAKAKEQQFEVDKGMLHLILDLLSYYTLN